MPKKRNSAKKSTKNIQSIGCPHAHTHNLPQLEIDVCFNCLIIYYSDYEFRKIEDSKEASQSIRVLKTYLEDIKVTAQVNRFHIQHKSFFDDLNAFFSDLDLLKKRLEVAIQQNSYQEFTAVKEESLQLKQKLESSQVMDVYSKYKVRSLLDRRVNGVANNEICRSIDKSASKHNEDTSNKELMSTLKEETKSTPKDEYTILMENYAEKYSEVVSKIQNLENEKSEVETKAIQLNNANKDLESKFKACEEAYNEAEKRCLKLKTEVDNSNSKHLEDEKRIDELEEEKENYIKQIEDCICSWAHNKTTIIELYKTKIGKALADNDADIELELSLNTQAHVDMFNLLCSIKFPNMKRVRFDYIKNNSKEFLQFLTYSLHNSFPLLSLNRDPSEMLDAEFYLKGLQRMGQVVTKEIHLTYFKFTKDSFEQFLKSCTKIDRLTFVCCIFNFDSDLDLSGPTYNISFMSFYCCGCSKNANWKTKSEGFERIVKAIAKSTLNDSLKTINNTELNVTQTKEVLKEFKIEHIEAKCEGNEPLLS